MKLQLAIQLVLSVNMRANMTRLGEMCVVHVCARVFEWHMDHKRRE